MQKQITYCRYAPSLGGGFAGTPEEVWGTPSYVYSKHKNEATIFFGLYDLRDYIALWRHKGKAWVLWAGSDIRNLRSGFIFNDGKLNWLSVLFRGIGADFRAWLIKNVISKAENWVENEAEAWSLRDMGIKVDGINPSFLGNIKDYKMKFRPGNKVWISASRGRELEYGWGILLNVAWALPELEFHFYGSDWPQVAEKLLGQGISWKQYFPNVRIHGRMTKWKMNKQVSKMQCGLRLNKHDGFSEVTAKSVLWGQYPITYLYNPHVDQYAGDNHGFIDTSDSLIKLYKLLKQIPKKKKANLKGRNWHVKNLNKYPWNKYV